jgi:hypothetical protein
MIKKVFAITLILIIYLPAVQAHEAPKHEHTQLVPIPVYTQPHGPSGAEASLKAANIFLASFAVDEKSNFIFELNAPERNNWSNLPAKFVKRSGISVGEMTDEQRTLLFEFLSSSLSKEGYDNVMNIMAAEAFLSQDKRAKKLQWMPENYWISFYGTPSADASWGWQYGGHHLALNILIENNKVVSLSPSFIGTEPAIFSYDGIDYKSVIDFHLAGYAVYDALNEVQKQQADAGSIPEDVLTGPGKDGVIPEQIGISVTDMDKTQRDLLMTAISKWVAVQPEENASLRMSQIEAEFDQTTFAWTGGNEVNTPCYMRIQGPSLIIELHSSGGNVGDSASGLGHYHTMYRNPKI